MNYTKNLEQAISYTRNSLKNHRLYDNLQNIEDIRTFMEQHVFAVWDFMSLLKSLQQTLTCTNLPWTPAYNPTLARFINEIVLGEESDVNVNGEPKSHFEMYLEAMQEVNASTCSVIQFMEKLKRGLSVNDALNDSKITPTTKNFVAYTFEVIASGQPHKIASAFTFGREDLIPDMFIEILQASEQREGKTYSQLRYYLERHIELDGDHHGPLALQMVSELCGADPVKWEEATQVAQEALEMRLKLWDSIADRITESAAV